MKLPILVLFCVVVIVINNRTALTQCRGEQSIGNIRLTGPRQSTTDGAVQICNQFIHGGSPFISWSYLNPENWSSEDARVACRQLGLSHSSPVFTILPSPPADNRIIIIEHPADCTGSETRLFDCINNIRDTSFRVQDYVAGLICNCVNGSLRLIDGPTNREGRVEVCQSGRWGTVCGEEWGDREAGLVCRELGFLAANATLLQLGERRGPSFRCEPQPEVLKLTECSTIPGNILCSVTGVRCLSHQDIPNSGNINSNNDGSLGTIILIASTVILAAALLTVIVGWIISCVYPCKKINQTNYSRKYTSQTNNSVTVSELSTRPHPPVGEEAVPHDTVGDVLTRDNALNSDYNGLTENQAYKVVGCVTNQSYGMARKGEYSVNDQDYEAI